MKRLIQTIQTAFSARRAQRPVTAQTDRLTALTEDTRHLLQIRWWLWRHCFLEAKRLQIESRMNRSDT